MGIHELAMDDTLGDFSPYRADGKLYGFVAVVTGASQPVGQAIIQELAAHGAASIYACDKAADSDAYSALVSMVAKIAPKTKIHPYPFNVAQEDETVVLIDEVLNTYGRLDVWVCSSGLLGQRTVHETSAVDLHKSFEAHAMAPFFALKYAPAAMAKQMTMKNNYLPYPNASPKTQPYGSIIVVSSVASTQPCWGVAYTMASHAALGVVKAGVAVLKGSGVRINCISPGQIDIGIDLQSQTQAAQSVPAPATGIDRPGQPQEVARVAGFLASGFSSYVNGANLVVDGGASAMNPLIKPI